MGTLRVVSGSREKYIHLNQGRVESVFTARSRHRIGRVLYNMWAVEKADITAVLKEQKSRKTKTPLGQMLLDRGLVKKEDLEAALKYQMVEEILEVFYWRNLSYEFFDGPPENSVPERIERLTRVGGSQAADGILLHVSKIIDDIEQFNQVTPSLKDVYELVEDPAEYFERAGASEHQRDLAMLVDGRRDVSEVFRELRLNSFDAMELFARLRSEGFIRPKNGFELLMLAENLRDELTPEKRARLLERVSELGVEGFDVSLRTAEAYEELEKKELAAEKYHEHARRLRLEGDLPGAERTIDQSIALYPNSTDLRGFRAMLLRKLSREDEAADELLAIAKIHRERDEHPLAERSVSAALAIRPDDEMIHRARFEILTAMGRPLRAANAGLALARLYEENKDLESAEKTLRPTVRLLPRSLRVRNRLAKLLALMGDSAGAAEEIGHMIPVVLERPAERPARAARILKALHSRLVELDALASPAMTALAEGFLALDDRDRALELLRRAGEAQVAANLLSDARETFGRAGEIDPEDLDIGETLALVQARLGAKDEAYLRLKGIAGSFQKRGIPDRAEKAYREILRLNPFSPDALIELAGLVADRGRKKESAEHMARAGQLYRASGNLEDAVGSLEKACRLDPRSSVYVRALADALADALKTKSNVEALDETLSMLLARQDHTGTLDVAFRILDLDPDHGAAGRALEDSFKALGRQVEARRNA